MIGGGHQRGTYSPNGAGTSILLLSHSYPPLPSPSAGYFPSWVVPTSTITQARRIVTPGSNLSLLPRAGGLVNGAA
jgi:hypothetical protein